MVHDLSAGGLLIESGASLGNGEALTVELPGSGPHEAVVAWSSTRFYGCRFTEPLGAAALSAALLKALPAGGKEPPRSPSAPVSPGARIAELRKARGLTMEELAARLHVSRQAVWYWETGRRLPKPAMQTSIADELGVSQAELLDDAAPSARLGRWKEEIANHFGVAPDRVKILLEL